MSTPTYSLAQPDRESSLDRFFTQLQPVVLPAVNLVVVTGPTHDQAMNLGMTLAKHVSSTLQTLIVGNSVTSSLQACAFPFDGYTTAEDVALHGAFPQDPYRILEPLCLTSGPSLTYYGLAEDEEGLWREDLNEGFDLLLRGGRYQAALFDLYGEGKQGLVADAAFSFLRTVPPILGLNGEEVLATDTSLKVVFWVVPSFEWLLEQLAQTSGAADLRGAVRMDVVSGVEEGFTHRQPPTPWATPILGSFPVYDKGPLLAPYLLPSRTFKEQKQEVNNRIPSLTVPDGDNRRVFMAFAPDGNRGRAFLEGVAWGKTVVLGRKKVKRKSVENVTRLSLSDLLGISDTWLEQCEYLDQFDTIIFDLFDYDLADHPSKLWHKGVTQGFSDTRLQNVVLLTDHPSTLEDLEIEAYGSALLHDTVEALRIYISGPGIYFAPQANLYRDEHLIMGLPSDQD